jgi:hypothetical protein
MNTGLKIFLFAVGAVIIVLFIALGISTGSTGKAIAEIGTAQVKEATEDKVSLLKAKYDGNSVIGSELVSLIEETIEDKDILSIVVYTLDGSRTDYNYVYDATTSAISKTNATTTITESKSSYSYINRNSLFTCEVKTDLNDSVICLWFEQEK